MQRSQLDIAPVAVDTWLLNWPLADEQLPPTELIAEIGQVAAQLRAHFGAAIRNTIPAYRSLMVQVDLSMLDWPAVESQIHAWRNQPLESRVRVAQHHRIQVCYDPELGEDLVEFAALKGLSPSEVSTLHSAKQYTVYAVGFLPGFAYLGYVDAQLAAPRRTSFRASVPAGSVAIADRQTAIYPSQSPGGWQIIGRAPRLPAPDAFSAGDTVEFVPISRYQYEQILGQSN